MRQWLGCLPNNTMRIVWNNVRAIFHATFFTIKRHPIFAVVLIFFSWAIYQSIMNPPPKPPLETPGTPEQIQARLINRHRAAEMQAANQQRAAAAAQRNRQLCMYEVICEKYGKVRQECATAGNFNTCIEVKMGNQSGLLYYCTNDGGVLQSIASDLHRGTMIRQSRLQIRRPRPEAGN